jgi:hypothetical protein
MKHVSRLLLTIAALATLGIGLTYVLARRDPYEGRSLARWLLLEIRRSAALDYRASEMSQVLEVKKAVVDDLVAERVSLREAAEQFRQANQWIENDGTGLVVPYYPPESEEGLYQQVIAWAKQQLSDDPKQAEQVIPRLEQGMAQQCHNETASGPPAGSSRSLDAKTKP